MANKRRHRRLTVGGTEYGWCFWHRHDRRGHSGCRSTVSLWRSDRASHVHFVFRPGGDRVVSEGFFERGTVVRLSDNAYLNLYEPGTVRALLEEAFVQGVFPESGTVEIDGWPLFDALLPDAASLDAASPLRFSPDSASPDSASPDVACPGAARPASGSTKRADRLSAGQSASLREVTGPPEAAAGT